ncbi:hypothetical protein [Cysteiniphilum halobium]|uniref:hypothetical protein n=1 Tax=Cysteiniphilum halobium TaxID=2219059 RepID=UPI000E64D5AA|nr:hypothetical protein [Cysteiniphilum halobium]
MKKLSLIIASSLMLSTTAFASVGVEKRDVTEAVEKVNNISFPKDGKPQPTNIEQLELTIKSAKHNKYIAATVHAANFVSLASKQYNAFYHAPEFQATIKYYDAFLHDLSDTISSFPKIDQMDKSLTNASTNLQQLWNARVAFLNAYDATSQNAYEFNYLLNYMAVHAINMTQNNSDLVKAQNTYVKFNALAYSIPTNAFNSYYQARGMAIETIYAINQDMVVSALQNVQTNAKVQQLSEAANDISAAIDGFLNLTYTFKFLGEDISIPLIPNQIKNMVHSALQKSGFNDTTNALKFLLTTTMEGQPIAADYNNIKNAKDNMFANVMFTLSTMLAQSINNNMQDPQFHISDEQAYYVITYHLAEMINKQLM